MYLLTMLVTGISIIEWPSLQYCAMTAVRGDALQSNAMLNKSSFIIIDVIKKMLLIQNPHLDFCLGFSSWSQ